MTTIQDALMTNSGLIRYSAIKRNLKKQGANTIAEKMAKEIESIGQTCSTHGFLEDPIIALDLNRRQLIVACPFCSAPELLATWEAQGE